METSVSRSIPKLTLAEMTDENGWSSSPKSFEIVKVENSVRWSIGDLVSEREIRSELSAGRIRTVLIRRKT